MIDLLNAGELFIDYSIRRDSSSLAAVGIPVRTSVNSEAAASPAPLKAAFSQQLARDEETLHLVVDGLKSLEEQWKQAQVLVAARQRGYFTPDEDDWVRQMLLSYRNYRLGLYEIIQRYWFYRAINDPEDRLHAFVLGLATALTLYSNSLKLVQAYEREPLVRKKLNEPDAKFELEEGFFDTVLRAYSSPWNYRELIRAVWFWQSNRRQIQSLLGPTRSSWLIGLVRRERVLVRKRLANVLICRLRYDWRAFWRTAILPVRKTRYNLQSLIGGACAGLHTTIGYQPALAGPVLERLKPFLRPGDVLLVRAEEKLTAALLPGFWAHAALFLGGRPDLERLGLCSHAHVCKHLPELEANSGSLGAVIEAISPRVLLNRLEHSLCADHVLVLRPNLPPSQIAAAISEAFGHLGKSYDFEFDFNVSSRLVCTELVYRCYHKRGAIQFPLVKRLGRFTLTADDIANLVLDSILNATVPGDAPFQVVTMILKIADGDAQFVPPPDVITVLAKIRSGWRPGKPKELGHE